MKQDATFTETAAYGSDAWCAAKLGKSLHWFRKNRGTLEREGFPKRDMLVGQTLKADVEAFLAKRRRVSDADVVAITGGKHHIKLHGENLENL